MALSEASITGFFTTPSYSFDITNNLLGLLVKEIETEILNKYNFPDIKSTELEIYVDVEVENKHRRIVKMCNKKDLRYLGFTFYLPYKNIVKNGTVNISDFIGEFTGALQTALSPYKTVPPELFKKLEKELIAKVGNNPKYRYMLTDKEIEFRKNIKELGKRFRAGLIS